jgi:hypothetical protein
VPARSGWFTSVFSGLRGGKKTPVGVEPTSTGLQPVAPREIDPALDKALDAVCAKAMATKPAER